MALLETAGVPNGGVSFWYSQIGRPEPGPPLPGDLECDVCIVGGGLTGLWTAYYLAKAEPGLRIVVLEAEFVGYGASGRNGGWLSAELPGNRDRYARGPYGVEGADRLAAELRATVDEVIGVCRAEAIEADIVRNGVLFVARSPAQLARLRDEVAGTADRRRGRRPDPDRRRPRRLVRPRLRPRPTGPVGAGPGRRRTTCSASRSTSRRASPRSSRDSPAPSTGPCGRRTSCAAWRATPPAWPASGAPGCR